jgi:LuxR family transcriptional regulator, maltose regulon positive regulatory protein
MDEPICTQGNRRQYDPLLTTKLYIPSLTQRVVPRPRLMDQLSMGMRRKLTLISAAAGSGKTTLLCEWLTSSPETHVAWVTLDEGDNDPVRFWRYVLAASLRFTPEEIVAFLRDIMGLTLTADQIEALEARTEGWITGLQLAALSMQSHTDIPHFLQTLGGSHRYTLDYLTDEVLQHQPEHIQAFLLHTSILDRLCASLCNALTQRTDSQETLTELEQANLFLVPLDEQRQWYRYHPLFADVLRLRLRRVERDQLAALHCRSSEWYALHGEEREVIHHAFLAQDWPCAAELIETIAIPTLWEYGELATVLHWLEKLPPDLIRSRPLLCLVHAWAAVLAGPHADAEFWMC